MSLLTYFCYRPTFNRRFQIRWLDRDGVLSKPQFAHSVRYQLLSERFEFPEGIKTFEGFVSRYGPSGIEYTEDQMLLIALFDINSRLRFAPGKDGVDVIKLREPPLASGPAIYSAMTRLMVGRNQKVIAPPFIRTMTLIPTGMDHPTADLLMMYERLDAYRFSYFFSRKGEKEVFWDTKTRKYGIRRRGIHILKPVLKMVFNKEPIRKPEGPVLSLRALAYQAFSYMHRTFFQTEHGPMLAYSGYNVHLKKPGMIKAFDQPSHAMSDKLRNHMHVIPAALNRVVDLLGTRRWFKKIRWRVNEALLYDAAITSGGERSDQPRVIMREKEKIRITAVGTKAVNARYTERSAKAFLESCRKGEPIKIDCCYKVVFKHEMHYASGAPGSQAAVQLKCREFFIPHATVIVIERVMCLFRHYINRGDVIRVGMPWFFGGAYKLYIYLNNCPGMTFDEGDFAKIDKTIKAILLALHVGSGYMYLDLDSMTVDDARIYRIALKILAKIRIVKVTRLEGNQWVVMTGVMPSGSFETSDGDSWIVVLLVCCWVEHLRETNPVACQLVDRYFFDEYRLVCYGDDHVMGFGVHLRAIMSEYGFAQYVLEFWDMEIKDAKVGQPLLTRVENDAVVESGITFLKRRLIAKPSHMPENCAPVVAWKPAWYHFVRIPYSAEGRISWSRVVCSIIGHAWDCQGTNLHAYNELAFLYNDVVSHLDLSSAGIRQMVEKEFADQKVKTKMLMKLGLKPESFFQFPTMSQLAMYNEYSDKSEYKKNPEEAFQTSDFSGLAAFEFGNDDDW